MSNLFQPGLKGDVSIFQMAHKFNMIDPFIPGQVSDGVISYGLSSYGYDIRVANEFKVFHNLNDGIVDPKNFDSSNFVEVTVNRGSIEIPPNSFALGRSVEYIKMPRNVTGIVLGKSTYARCGVIINCTPLEAGWEGYITIEISNTTPLPSRIYANEGIAQVLFFQSPDECLVSYADKGGKYMNAQGLQLPKVTRKLR